MSSEAPTCFVGIALGLGWQLRESAQALKALAVQCQELTGAAVVTTSDEGSEAGSEEDQEDQSSSDGSSDGERKQAPRGTYGGYSSAKPRFSDEWAIGRCALDIEFSRIVLLYRVW